MYNLPDSGEQTPMTQDLTQALTHGQRLDLYYWMRLTRTFDERMVAHLEAGPRRGRHLQPARP